MRSGGLWFEVRAGKYFARPPLQNNKSKMDWRCGSSGRGVQTPAPSKKKKAKEVLHFDLGRDPSFSLKEKIES
jgi:hypothetical protein